MCVVARSRLGADVLLIRNVDTWQLVINTITTIITFFDGRVAPETVRPGAIRRSSTSSTPLPTGSPTS